MPDVESFNDFVYPEYLVRKFNISYNYSAGLWCMNKVKAIPSEGGLLAFAPVFPGGKQNIERNSEYPEPGKRNLINIMSSDNTSLRNYRPDPPFSLTETDSLKILCNRFNLNADVYTFADATTFILPHMK
jgi:hypothetical protein